jgi:hypothetical protein
MLTLRYSFCLTLVFVAALAVGCSDETAPLPPAPDGSQPCSPTTCGTGCCNYAQCMPGNAPTACGTAGFPCVVCTGNEVCQNGQCMPPAGGCGPVNCASGCCAGQICKPGDAATACGTAGAICTDCTKSGGTCPNKTCQGGTGCSSSSCNGCCSSNQCFQGNTHALCGKGGVACVDCAAQSKSCDSASGTCGSAPPTCGAGSCSGCCSGNTCQAGKVDTACGMGGVNCVDCTSFGASCDGAAGKCKGGRPTCGPATCASGCCDNNQCMPGNTTAACGGGGGACANCGSGSCDLATKTCKATPPPPCGPSNCTGCCDAGGKCKTGITDSLCGQGGGSCVDCTAQSKTCDAPSGTCKSGTPTCGPTSCKWGCCDTSGTCQGGVKDSECGINGSSCLDCAALGKTCDLISGLCKTATPTCGPGNCSGCCSTSGTCLGGTSSSSCGSGGVSCKSCKSYQTCSSGSCSISSTSKWELKVVGATINKLKSWDSFGGAPDPYFGIDWDTCSKWSVESPHAPTQSDTYNPSWNFSMGTFSASKIKGGWCAFVGDSDLGGTFNTIALCKIYVYTSDLEAGSKTLSSCVNPDDGKNYVTWLKFTFTYKP